MVPRIARPQPTGSSRLSASKILTLRLKFVMVDDRSIRLRHEIGVKDFST